MRSHQDHITSTWDFTRAGSRVERVTTTDISPIQGQTITILTCPKILERLELFSLGVIVRRYSNQKAMDVLGEPTSCATICREGMKMTYT